MPVSRDADECKVTQVSDVNGVPDIHSLSLPRGGVITRSLCNSEQSICLPLTVLLEQSAPNWAFANRNLPNFWWRGSPQSPFQQILGLVRAADFLQDDHEDEIASVKPSDRHLGRKSAPREYTLSHQRSSFQNVTFGGHTLWQQP